MGRDDWREVQVSDLVAAGSLAINDGYRVRNAELGPVGTPFVRGGDIGFGWIETDVADHIRPEFQERVSSKLTREGDVAFITKGTVGRVGYLRAGQPSVVFAPQVCYWRVLNSDVLDHRFLYFHLNGPEFQANLDAVKTHGSMVADYVSLSDQRQFRLRLPRIEKQRAIGCLLGSLDDKIELNRRTNETLEAMARTLFRSWFVDFDPVRAKADGQMPSGLDAATAKLFPDSFEPSALGPIPKGWRVGVLADVLTPTIGGDWGEDQPAGDLVSCRCLRGVDLEQLRRDGFADPPIRWLSPSSKLKRNLDATDILIAASGAGPLGRPLYATHHLNHLFPEGVVYSNFCKRLRAETPEAAIYFDRYLAELHISGSVWEYASGTAVPNLDLSGLLRGESVVIPPTTIMAAFSEFLRPIYSRLYSMESRTLAATRDALLPKLLSGEVSVSANHPHTEGR